MWHSLYHAQIKQLQHRLKVSKASTADSCFKLDFPSVHIHVHANVLYTWSIILHCYNNRCYVYTCTHEREVTNGWHLTSFLLHVYTYGTCMPASSNGAKPTEWTAVYIINTISIQLQRKPPFLSKNTGCYHDFISHNQLLVLCQE